MEVTDVRVRKVDKEGKMKAIVSITFDEEFVIHDIKVIEGEKGACLSLCHPEKLRTVSIEILLTLSAPPRENYFSRLFWRNTKRTPRERKKRIFNLEGRNIIYVRG